MFKIGTLFISINFKLSFHSKLILFSPYDSICNCIIRALFSIQKLNEKNLFPYNINSLIQNLTRIEELYEFYDENIEKNENEEIDDNEIDDNEIKEIEEVEDHYRYFVRGRNYCNKESNNISSNFKGNNIHRDTIIHVNDNNKFGEVDFNENIDIEEGEVFNDDTNNDSYGIILHLTDIQENENSSCSYVNGNNDMKNDNDNNDIINIDIKEEGDDSDEIILHLANWHI
jgi:hypothetical protein